ncbi:WD40-repeat-containing domain protein [Aspergillus granulosus]|uniref:WD40-repeat-containing domain protein n=1 Tax=Aspergillus granulosus TaxID=176169 RepID=A0ABR4I570_9EURO
MSSLDPSLYTVAWIAPLEIEVQAALHMLDRVHSGRFVNSGNRYVYHAGDMCGHKVIIATLAAGQTYGTNAATSLASHVRHYFPNLWFGLLVGVAAGLPNLSFSPPRDIRLGDVIVALPDGKNPAILPYGLGKQTGQNEFELLRYGHSLPPTEYIVGSAIGKIKASEQEAKAVLGYYKDVIQKAPKFSDPGQDHDILYLSEDNISVQRLRRRDTERTRVWYGSIGSGDRLLEIRHDRDELRDKYNVIGLEMEAAGVLHEIPVGNIRGVCDYGDERKNKDWQPYAAIMAAAYAKAVLAEIPPRSAGQVPRMNNDFTDEYRHYLKNSKGGLPEPDIFMLQLELMRTVKEKDRLRLEKEMLDQEIKEKTSTINYAQRRFVTIEEEIRKLDEEKALLADTWKTESKRVHNIQTRGKEINQQQVDLSKRELLIKEQLSGLQQTAMEDGYDLSLLQTSSEDIRVDSFDPEKLVTRVTLTGHSNYVRTLAFSPDGKLVASGSYDNTVRLWDSATGATRSTLTGHSDYVYTVAFSPDGKLVASGSGDKTVRLWDPATGAARSTLTGHSDYVPTVAFSPDGKLVASGSRDKTVRLWDPATGTARSTLTGHSGYVSTVAFSTDGKLVASSSYDNTVRLWDSATGAARSMLTGHCGLVSTVAFSSDGKLVASSSGDGTVRLWDLATVTARSTLTGHSGYVSTVAFSPDGKLVASGSGDGTVRLWDPSTGTACSTLTGHCGLVSTVVFSPDGKLVASGSGDGTVRLWDSATGAARRTLTGHSDYVYTVAFSPDGKLVASSSRDKTVCLWGAQST